MSDADGQTKTKEEPKKDVNAASGSSDGLIGNRRMRTFIIGGLLIAWSLWFWAYFNGGSFWYILVAISQACVLVCSIMLVVFHCIGKDGGIETIVGWILTIAGAVYIGCYVLLTIPLLKSNGFTIFFVIVGQASLPGCTAIFLGLDAAKDFMAEEGRRLFANLLALAIAAGANQIGYYGTPNAPFGIVMLALGYSIILICCVVYLVLFICKCCTCNCKDNCITRLLLSGGLIAGGALAGIGYFTILQGGTYYVGYAILVVGLCVTWALDMGIVDSVKNAKGGAK